MPHGIIAEDQPSPVGLSDAVRPVHLECLTARLGKLLGAFARVDDAHTAGHGGVIGYDSDDRGEVEDFVGNDPFTEAGRFESVTISRCRKAFFDDGRLV
jgi:uncharacterized protein YciI